MKVSDIQVEICANSVQSAIHAAIAGADRIELCDNLFEGGTTPPASWISYCVDNLILKSHVLIRPRPGDFLYNSHEFQLMLDDIKLCKDLGAHGVVIGALKSDGRVDMEMTQALIQAADGLSITFHRAIDVSRDPLHEIKRLKELAIDRVLTSGGKRNVQEGMVNLKLMVEIADGKFSVMPGGGVRTHNIRELIEYTGANEFHTSMLSPHPSKMEYHNPDVPMASISGYNEKSRLLSDVDKIKEFYEEIRLISFE